MAYARTVYVVPVFVLLCMTARGQSPLDTYLVSPVLGSAATKTEWTAFITKRLPPLVCPASSEEWDKQARQLRRRMLDHVVLRGVPEPWYSGPVRVEWVSDIDTGKGYRIRKLRYEGAPGMWIPALIYEPLPAGGKVPAVLTVNGHGADGKAIEEEQIRSIVLAKRGVIALHPEWIGFGELNQEENTNHNNLAYLNLCGVSGTSVFYLAMKRGLDVLMDYPPVDTNRVAMTGLSGGGWQTILLSSLDTRIATAVPNAGYSGIDMRIAYASDIGDLEQVPPDLLTVADYSHLTALLAPRPALLIYNAKDDCCFKADHMAPSVYNPVVPFYRLYNRADVFRFYVNNDPGTHNYALDNRLRFYAHLSENFGLGWDNTEPPVDGEIKTGEELKVGVPENNATLASLALSFAEKLPVDPAPIADPIALDKWQDDAKQRLRAIIRLPEIVPAAAEKKSDATIDGARCTTYVLTVGEWSVPAVAIEPPEGECPVTTLLFGDEGKTKLADVAAKLIGSGSRVVAMDLLFQGECAIKEGNPYQHAAMVETTGERVLGQMVAQVESIAAWAKTAFGAPVAVYSRGRTSGVAALMYGGLHRAELQHLTTEGAPATLKDLVTQRVSYNDYPALFCFGLLHEFDIRDLAALCRGTQVSLTKTPASN